jgi:hypothetical protein
MWKRHCVFLRKNKNVMDFFQLLKSKEFYLEPSAKKREERKKNTGEHEKRAKKT